MTTPTAADYTSLIAGEHSAQPKFKDTIAFLAQGSIDAQAMLATMPTMRDVDVAVGVHLDALGLWIGLPRYIFVPTLGTVNLSDDDYRTLLRARIAANHWDGGMETLQAILAGLFPGTGITLRAHDNQDMSMYILIIGGALSVTQQALLTGGLLVPKPSAVRISGYYTLTGPLFGLSQQDDFVAGPDFGAFF